MGELAILGREGDTKVMWDPSNRDEVGVARRTFSDLKKKGFSAFRVMPDGEQGEQVREFNPEDEKIIMVPALQGG